MAITRRDASEAKGVDKAYLLAAILLEQAVQNILDDTANDMYDVVMKNSNSSGLQDQDKTITALIELLAAMLILFDKAMENGIRSIATSKKAKFIEDSIPFLRSAKAGVAADLFKRELGNFEDDMVTVFRTAKSGAYDLTYADRLNKIDSSSERVIRNLIGSAVRDGADGKTIAERLDRYINPLAGSTPVRPWDILRNATKSLKSFTPSDVLPGSVQYNLINLSRTQSAELFRSMTSKAYDDKKWIEGYHWVLSRSHPKEDICDELAAHGLYKRTDKRPFSHNLCLCDWVAEPVSLDKLLRLLKQNKI